MQRRVRKTDKSTIFIFDKSLGEGRREEKTPNRDENVNSDAESFTSLLFIHPSLRFSREFFSSRHRDERR